MHPPQVGHSLCYQVPSGKKLGTVDTNVILGKALLSSCHASGRFVVIHTSNEKSVCVLNPRAKLPSFGVIHWELAWHFYQVHLVPNRSRHMTSLWHLFPMNRLKSSGPALKSKALF